MYNLVKIILVNGEEVELHKRIHEYLVAGYKYKDKHARITIKEKLRRLGVKDYRSVRSIIFKSDDGETLTLEVY